MLVAFDPFEHKPFRTKRMELLPFAITAGAEGNTSFYINEKIGDSGARANYTVHKSLDGGRTWPHATVVYPGGSAYSDMALLRNGSIGVFFEKDNYNTLSFATIGR